jgi:hypothetical protein
VSETPPPGAGQPWSGEACPLCGTQLHPHQEWCLNCGAAARTRVAAAPNWKGPLATLAVVVALSLGVLAAALVKLAAGSTAPPAITRTVTTAAAVPAPTQTTPPGSALGGSASTSTTPGAPGTGTAGATTSPTTASPGAAKPAGPQAKPLGIPRHLQEQLRKYKLKLKLKLKLGLPAQTNRG